MCKYCNADNYSYHIEGVKELTLGFKHFTGLRMRFHSENNKFTLVADGEGEVEMEIDYCPKCGRKLSN